MSESSKETGQGEEGDDRWVIVWKTQTWHGSKKEIRWKGGYGTVKSKKTDIKGEKKCELMDRVIERRKERRVNKRGYGQRQCQKRD